MAKPNLDDLPQRLGAIIKADPNYQRLAELGPPDPDPEPRCRWCHDGGYLRHDVPPGAPEFGKLIVCACKAPELTARRVARFWSSSQAPVRYADCTLESYPGDPSAVDRLRSWLEGERWLILTGEHGAGKTGLTVALLRELDQRDRSVLFVNAPAMLRRVRATYGQHTEAETEAAVIDSLAEVDVLAIDDLGKERKTPWSSELLYDIANRRYLAARRTIVTTNLDAYALETHVGPAIFGRLFEQSAWLTLSGNLRRRGRSG